MDKRSSGRFYRLYFASRSALSKIINIINKFEIASIDQDPPWYRRINYSDINFTGVKTAFTGVIEMIKINK